MRRIISASLALAAIVWLAFVVERARGFDAPEQAASCVRWYSRSVRHGQRTSSPAASLTDGDREDAVREWAALAL